MKRALAGLALAFALALSACSGRDGTIDVTVVTAPGSHVMDAVTRVRMILSLPLTVVDADRKADGTFDLSLQVEAQGPSADITLLGLDATGAVVAYGRTPPLPIAAIDASIAIYVAPPTSLAEAPTTLGTARTDLGAAVIDFGVLLAGGRDAAGAPTADLDVYNTYDQKLEKGADLPEPRAGIAVGAGISGYVYLFGGTDAAGAARGNLWRYDTTVSADQAWTKVDEVTAQARADVAVAPLGSDAFLLTGDPPLLYEGLYLRVTPFAAPTTLHGGTASVQDVASPGAPTYALVIGQGAGTTGITRLSTDAFDAESNAPADALRTGHAVVATTAGHVLAVGGADASGPLRSLIDCDPIGRNYQSVPDVLATGRTDAAVAVTDQYLVVAGGRDASGTMVPDAEIFASDTFAPIGSVPMVVPRAGAIAEPLPNGQILIAGGVDTSGAPVATLELFTPPVPPDLVP